MDRIVDTGRRAGIRHDRARGKMGQQPDESFHLRFVVKNDHSTELTLVVEPWGQVIAKLDHDEPGVLLAELDSAASSKARAAIPVLTNARAFTGP